MGGHRILYLGAHQLTAYRRQGGGIHADGSFAVSPDGLAAFADYVTMHRKSLFTLLVNLAEEAFQAETIPYLRAGDRRAVITRKLSQLFYATPYTASLSLGHEKNRRKDERLLLAALTAPGSLDPWLTVLRDRRVALSGIYSLPFIGAALLKKLHIDDERCLLLTVQDQSLRESYFERGHLHFSRLSPLSQSSIGGIAQALATEAMKLQQYLLSQRLIARNQPLRAIVVAHPQALKAVAGSCISTDSLTFDIRSTIDCARQIGLKTPPADSHLDTAYAHLAAATPPAVQFAAAPLRHDYRLRQIRDGLYGLGAAVFAASLLFAGQQLYAAHGLAQETAETLARAQGARQRYEDIVRTFPQIPASNETLRQIISRHAEFERSGASPEAFYRDLSAALDKAPAVDLDSIDWHAADSVPQTGTPGGGTAPVGSGQFVQLRGTVNLGPRATPRQLLAAFQQFVDALGANPALSVTVSQQPFDVGTGKALRGGEAETATGIRPFALQITRRSGA
ncbi:MAG: hypothetical protein HYU78_15655 [Rhodocyclales bacterium]|nr:hypothetical protein [Rhodocyclales bacterium]